MRLILRFFGILFSAGFMLFLIGSAVAAVAFMHFSQDLPDHEQLAEYEPPVMSRVHAADGSLVAEYATERRLYLPIGAIPDMLKAAFLSAEDKNFYRHHGVDPEGIVRAAVANLASGGRIQQGASTITQQVAKNFLLSSEQTIDRKIREALIAFRMESAFSKDTILELYLNEIFLGTLTPGRNLHGVAAAALDYFGKSVHELTLAEMAYLAALPKAPNNYHPFRREAEAVGRRNWVLDRMVDNGYVTAEEAEAAKAEPLVVNPRNVSPNTLAAGYFVEEVRREITNFYGPEKLYEGGLSVRSTLDPRMQAMARKALVDGLVRYDESRGGWRGAQEQIDLNAGEWGALLAEISALGDVDPWRLAVVLDIADGEARIGLQPGRLSGGQVAEERETGVIRAAGAEWTNRSVAEALDPGDVIYVEPLSGDREFRLRQVPEVSGGLVAMDPHSGRVHAIVGGFSFDQSQFNRATQARRQPGSAYKPFVYAAALDNGYTPSTIVLDGPITINNPGSEPWSPTNYDNSFAGPRTLRYGIEFSKNLMTVRLAQNVGMPMIAEYSRRFGIYDDMAPLLSMSLGAGETTVMRMTAAYAMLVNGGKRIRPTLVDRIQDRTGETIFRHDRRECHGCVADGWSGQNEPVLIDEREQVIDSHSAYQMTSILEGVVERGTARTVQAVGKPLAGKTGTTNDARDVWFVGFSPDLAVGVYIGFDQPRSLGRRVAAGTYAAPIFRDFMAMALEDEPATPFRVPPGIKLVHVNAGDGTRSAPGAPGTIREAFKPGTAPPSNLAGTGLDADWGFDSVSQFDGGPVEPRFDAPPPPASSEWNPWNDVGSGEDWGVAEDDPGSSIGASGLY
ncbi:penicillin-binding protein 1A [Saliniramus sp.]|uniref:penicillin-binding protein 1A n=1 Tax=Saliniramus sp. TaxID=2986772 RepID=UPI002C3AD3A6|nr:penicillin-binding protein 1A [Saliniramus sp.]HMB09863.1 penicillin-binding protein 1A [Saliniramus sp.]